MKHFQSAEASELKREREKIAVVRVDCTFYIGVDQGCYRNEAQMLASFSYYYFVFDAQEDENGRENVRAKNEFYFI